MENDITNQQELLAKNLAYYRKASGLTQLELAEKFNYSDKSVSKWERGEGFPDIFVLKSLADFYGITVDDFYQSEHKAVKVSQNKKRKQTYLKLLSIGINWLVTVLTFFLLNTLLSRFAPDAPFEPWLTFIYGTLTTGIILLVWEFIYHNRFLRMIAASIIIWTAALSIFLTFLVVMNLPLPLLFIVAIPLEVLEIIWYLFRRNRKR
jgi:transcriptional regulator with XRE-family HTH domain